MFSRKWGIKCQSRRGTICFVLNEYLKKRCLGNNNLTASQAILESIVLKS